MKLRTVSNNRLTLDNRFDFAMVDKPADIPYGSNALIVRNGYKFVGLCESLPTHLSETHPNELPLLFFNWEHDQYVWMFLSISKSRLASLQLIE